MKKRNNIQARKQSFSLIFGLSMALLLFFQQPYLVKNCDTSEQTEQADDEENGEKPEASYHIMAYEILMPVMQFNLFHSFDLLLEIPNPDKTDFMSMEYAEKVYHNYFFTLFRQFISPNAP